MEAIYLLIPLSVLAMFAAAWLFLRMSDSGQFDDLDGPAWSILHDDDRPAGPAANPRAQLPACATAGSKPRLDAAQHEQPRSEPESGALGRGSE